MESQTIRILDDTIEDLPARKPFTGLGIGLDDLDVPARKFRFIRYVMLDAGGQTLWRGAVDADDLTGDALIIVRRGIAASEREGEAEWADEVRMVTGD